MKSIEHLEQLVTVAKAQVPTGSRWMHYKDPASMYAISGHVVIEATAEVAICYTPKDMTLEFSRPLSNFLEMIVDEGSPIKRFIQLGQQRP
jgi:hypothetical protein